MFPRSGQIVGQPKRSEDLSIQTASWQSAHTLFIYTFRACVYGYLSRYIVFGTSPGVHTANRNAEAHVEERLQFLQAMIGKQG
jgi:hypothetical protein